jgi:hypothetical protein
MTEQSMKFFGTAIIFVCLALAVTSASAEMFTGKKWFQFCVASKRADKQASNPKTMSMSDAYFGI